jgi:AraC-like DNA-binding protein
MLAVQHARPHPNLTSFVRAYVQRRAQALPTAAALEPFVARVGVMLDFLFADLYRLPIRGTDVASRCFRAAIVGPHSDCHVELIPDGRIDEIAVIFHPYGFYSMFGEPTNMFANKGIEARAVLGAPLQQLSEQLGSTDSFLTRVKLLDEYLLRSLDLVAAFDPFITTLDSLVAPAVSTTISQAAHQAGVSLRQLERRCITYTGLSPKKLVRIARFERALRMRWSTNASWTTIAHQLNYHDQMHLIHDFRSLAGHAPNELVKRMHSDYLIGLDQE